MTDFKDVLNVGSFTGEKDSVITVSLKNGVQHSGWVEDLNSSGIVTLQPSGHGRRSRFHVDDVMSISWSA